MFLPNVLVLVAAVALLSLSPARIPAPTSPTRVALLLLGLTLVIALDLVLMKRAFAPLERLAQVMRQVHPLNPGMRIPRYGLSAEVVELTEAFNDMLDRLESERRDYARRVFLAEEYERRRIARELHDQIGQTVTALILTIGRAKVRQGGLYGADLEEAAHSSHSVLDDLHSIVRRLRPEALEDLGLVRALESLGIRAAQPAGLRLDRHFDASLPSLNGEQELVIYRIAQESLTNVVRHARATRTSISLRRKHQGVRFALDDDGVGIDATPSAGIGIRGMRERALMIGAYLRIERSPLGGTRVVLDVGVEQ